MTTDNNIGTLSLAETAKRLGIGVTTAYQLVARNEFPIPVRRIGRTQKVKLISTCTLRSSDSKTNPSPTALAVDGDVLRRHIRQLRQTAAHLQAEADDLETWATKTGRLGCPTA